MFGLKDADLSEPVNNAAILGAWYVNVFPLERRKALIFVSDRTYLSFIIYGARKDNIRDVPGLLRRGLGQLLAFFEMHPEKIERALSDLEPAQFTKTSSPKVLGNVNDLMRFYKHCVWYDGGLEQCDLTRITMQANQMPQRNLGWRYSIEVADELLELGQAL